METTNYMDVQLTISSSLAFKVPVQLGTNLVKPERSSS